MKSACLLLNKLTSLPIDIFIFTSHVCPLNNIASSNPIHRWDMELVNWFYSNYKICNPLWPVAATNHWTNWPIYELIWVNDSNSLTWNLRPFGGNSPNPNHDSRFRSEWGHPIHRRAASDHIEPQPLRAALARNQLQGCPPARRCRQRRIETDHLFGKRWTGGKIISDEIVIWGLYWVMGLIWGLYIITHHLGVVISMVVWCEKSSKNICVLRGLVIR